MTSSPKLRYFLILQFLLLASFYAASGQGNISPSGQNCGEPVETAGNGNNDQTIQGWAAGAAVNVNINPTGYSQDQLNAIAQAFTNWSGTGGVSFNITYSATPISGSSTYQVTQGVPSSDPTSIAETGTATNASGVATSATTTINSQVTNLTALTITTAHEIGHTFGLDDSDTTSSVMASGCGDYNTTTGCGTVGPTSADVSAADCQDIYSSNTCLAPGDDSNPNCNCGAGTSGDCSGGLTCSNGTCDCSDVCDDSSCPGYDCDSCGTNCGDSCSTDDDCPGGLVCLGGTCGCSSYCDDPSCDPNYACDCMGECGCIDNGDECDPNSCSYDYNDCNGGGGENDSRNDMPVFPFRLPPDVWPATGVTFASILPAMIGVRRRKRKDGLEEESDHVE